MARRSRAGWSRASPLLDLAALVDRSTRSPGGEAGRYRAAPPRRAGRGARSSARACPTPCRSEWSTKLVREPDGSPRWIAADLRLAPGNSGGPLAGGRRTHRRDQHAGGRRDWGIAVPVSLIDGFLRRAGDRTGRTGGVTRVLVTATSPTIRAGLRRAARGLSRISPCSRRRDGPASLPTWRRPWRRTWCFSRWSRASRCRCRSRYRPMRRVASRRWS